MRETRAAATSVRLVFSSEIRLVDLAHAAAEKMAEVVGLDADEALNVGLAAREAVINAIVHGNRRQPARKVHMTITGEPRRLRVTVRDHGLGFDPDREPDPTDEDNLLNTSGRGLLLMRAFVDEVRFRRRPGGGLEVTLIKALGQTTDGSRRAPSELRSSEGKSDPRRNRA